MTVICEIMSCKLVPVCILFLLTFSLGVRCDNNCTHTKEIVTCKNVNLTKGILTLNISESVKTVDITGGSIYDLPPYLFSNCSNDSSKVLKNLKHLYLSGNEIRKIHGETFDCFPNLETLSLSNNSWYVRNYSDFFSTLSNLKKLDLSHTFDHMYNVTTRMVIRMSYVLYGSKMNNLEELNLSNNDLLVFTNESSQSLCRLPKLKRLDLSSNALSKASLEVCNGQLAFLDLSSNNFERVTAETLHIYDTIQKSSPNFTVSFIDNEWDCDCNLKDFVKWLKTTRVNVLKKSGFKCHDGLSFHKKLVDIDISELKCHSYPMHGIVKTPIIVLGIVLAIVCIVVVVALFTRRRSIKNWFKNVKEQHQSGRNDGYSIV